MPPSPTQTSNFYGSSTTHFLLFTLLISCLFPGIFHYIWTFPLTFLGLLSPDSSFVSPHRQNHFLNRRGSNHHPEESSTMWFQKQITLPAQSRGTYLITNDITSALPELRDYKVGILHLFMQHTSCALSLNENCDSDVRADMTDALDRVAPEYGPKGEELYRHDDEGPDDMPAHVKSVLVGASLSIPIKDGRLATGTWQGIYYLEFRAMKHSRRIMATIQGEKK